MIDPGLAGKVALVTGANNPEGVGAATACALAAQQAKVVLSQRAMNGYPLRRIGDPADVADVIVFLASEQARWLTGQLLYVGGGYAMPR